MVAIAAAMRSLASSRPLWLISLVQRLTKPWQDGRRRSTAEHAESVG